MGEVQMQKAARSMSCLLVVLLLVITVVNPLPALAEPKLVPDDILAQAIRGKLGLDSSVELTPAHLAGLTELVLHYTGVESLEGLQYAVNLTKLDINIAPLEELPDGLFDNMSNLSILRLNNVHLSELPEGIFDNLANLTVLDLHSCGIESLPPGIFDNLTGLEELVLDYNMIRTLPAGIFDNLISLRELELYSIGIDSLPDGVFDNLSALEVLDLGGNFISFLETDVFSSLTNLRYLSLEGNMLTGIPDGFFDHLGGLEYLSLCRNKIRELPDGVFSGLSNLNELDLSNNKIGSIGKGVLRGLDNLESLYLDQNELAQLPEDIFEPVPNLVALGLGRNRLTSIPASLFDGLSGLQELDLSYNMIPTLPDDFLAGKSMRELWLGGMGLTEVPGFIRNMDTLKYLDLSYNRIKAIEPGAFDNLIDLEHLDLGMNYLTSLPDGLFDKWFEALESKDIDGNNRLLIFLGLYDNLFIDAADSYTGLLMNDPPKFNYLPFSIKSGLYERKYPWFTDLSVSGGQAWVYPWYESPDEDLLDSLRLMALKYGALRSRNIAPFMDYLLYGFLDLPVVPDTMFNKSYDEVADIWYNEYEFDLCANLLGGGPYYKAEMLLYLEMMVESLVGHDIEPLQSYEEFWVYFAQLTGMPLEPGFTFEEFVIAFTMYMVSQGRFYQEFESFEEFVLFMAYYFHGSKKLDALEDGTFVADLFFDRNSYLSSNIWIVTDENSPDPVVLRLSNAIHNGTRIEELLINGAPGQYTQEADGSYTIELPAGIGEYTMIIRTRYEGDAMFDDPSILNAEFAIVVNIAASSQAGIVGGRLNGADVTVDDVNRTISASIKDFDIDAADLSGLIASFNATIASIVRGGRLYITVTSEDGTNVIEYLFINTYEAEPEATPTPGPTEDPGSDNPRTGDGYSAMLFILAASSIGLLILARKRALAAR